MFKALFQWFVRKLKDEFRDQIDAAYWSGVFGTAGAACLAVAFMDQKMLAFIAGLISCFWGLRLYRKSRQV